MKMIPHQRLIELVHYDISTGYFTRKIARGKYPAGSRTGRIKPDGYVYVIVDGEDYAAQRLAWLYVTGEWPESCHVDHRNCDGSDNRWINLRRASFQQNQANSRKPKNNTSGFKGVTWNRQRGKWQAGIMVNRVHRHLGLFREKLDAAAAYANAASAHFGEFARTQDPPAAARAIGVNGLAPVTVQ